MRQGPGPLAAVVGEDVGCHGRGPAETEKAGEEGWVRADAAASADARRSLRGGGSGPVTGAAEWDASEVREVSRDDAPFPPLRPLRT